MTNKTDKNNRTTRAGAQLQSELASTNTNPSTDDAQTQAPKCSGNDAHGRRFPLGQIVATSHAAGVLSPWDILEGLMRHESGDWGDICDEDRQGNEQALEVGNRLMSVYKNPEGVVFWIITEWDRSVTTVLLPDDY